MLPYYGTLRIGVHFIPVLILKFCKSFFHQTSFATVKNIFPLVFSFDSVCLGKGKEVCDVWLGNTANGLNKVIGCAVYTCTPGKTLPMQTAADEVACTY